MIFSKKFSRIHNVWRSALQMPSLGDLTRQEETDFENQFAAANAEMTGEDPAIVGGLLHPEKACAICGRVHWNPLHRWASTWTFVSKEEIGVYFELSWFVATAIICGLWSWFVATPLEYWGTEREFQDMPTLFRLFYGLIAFVVYWVASFSMEIGTDQYRIRHLVAPPILFYWMRWGKLLLRWLVYAYLVYTTALALWRGIVP